MIVVADTSPLNYLVLIDEAELLHDLFGYVLLPQAVLTELQHPRTPAKVRQWITRMPEWLDMRTVAQITHPVITQLDPGEAEAIQLALDLGITTMLIDDAEARRTAESLHLEVRGTLAILERGSRLGLTDLSRAFSKLHQTNFRMSRSVRTAFLKRNS